MGEIYGEQEKGRDFVLLFYPNYDWNTVACRKKPAWFNEGVNLGHQIMRKYNMSTICYRRFEESYLTVK